MPVPTRGEHHEVVPVSLHHPLAVSEGMTQRARPFPSVTRAGSVHRQTDETAVVEDLVALGLTDRRT